MSKDYLLCNLSYFIIQLYQEITGIKGKGYVRIDISLLTREEREGGRDVSSNIVASLDRTSLCISQD